MATSVPPGMAMPSAGIGGARTAAEQMADRRHAEVLLEDAVHASLPEDIDNPDPWAGGNDPWSRPFEAENPVMGTGGLASEDSRVPHSYSPPGLPRDGDGVPPSGMDGVGNQGFGNHGGIPPPLHHGVPQGWPHQVPSHPGVFPGGPLVYTHI